MQLDRVMTDCLDSILHSASALLTEVHAAYQNGEVTASQIECVFHLRDDLGQLLAKFGDGPAFRMPPGASTMNAMRNYEQMADAWLSAIYAAACDVPLDECETVKPGLYRVTRKRQTAQGFLLNQIACANPAVARRRLDEWEAAATGKSAE
jgi:hypothetical protein